jgi:HSP20 family protein
MSTALAPKLSRVQGEIDRVFNRFFNADLMDPLMPQLLAETGNAMFNPHLDLTETDNEFVLRVEVPGIPKENVDVQLVGDVLTISGHRDKTTEKQGETCLWREQEYGQFSRALRLPMPVIGAKVDAIHNDGVLTVRLPKAVPAVSTRITIK